MMTHFLFIALFLSFFTAPLLAVVAHDRRHHVQRFVKSPRRVLMLRMAEKIDWMKPAAGASNAGIAFTADGTVIGSGDRNWVTARTIDGHTLWVFPATHALTTAPFVKGEFVYLTFRSGEVVKLRTSTGGLIWRKKLSSYVSRELVVSSGVVLAATIGQHLHALNDKDGNDEWLYDSGGTKGMVVQGGAPPVVAERTVYYGNANGELIVLNLKTGKVRKRHVLGDDLNARFQDVVGRLIVSKSGMLMFTNGGGKIGAIDLNSPTYQLKWQNKFSPIATSVCDDEMCYIGLAAGEVASLNIQNGDVRWHKTLGWAVTHITLHDNHLYVSGSEGFVIKLRRASGTRVWQEDLGSTISAPPVVFRGIIYFTTNMRNAYGYRL